MIKALSKDKNGESVILLGLSHENLRRLREDQPILCDLRELGLTGKVIIMAGETEDTIKVQIEDVANIKEVIDKRP